MTMCPFLFASAVNDPSVLPYTSSYMPVCPQYECASFLPYGEHTLVICYVPSNLTDDYYYEWFFVDMGVDNTKFNFIPHKNGLKYSLNLTSESPVYRYFSPSHDGNFTLTREGQWSNPSPDKTVWTLYNFSSFGASYAHSNAKIVSNHPPIYAGMSIQQATEYGVYPVSAFNGTLTDSYLADYPDNVSHAIDSISDCVGLLSQYYTSLNSKINALSIDVQYAQGQNNEIISRVNALQSLVDSQGGEYQSVLNQAQSEIESNAQSAAQSAADDINNAGEDVSDLDNDMDDVNSIVETLDGWIDDLDDFADRIDDSIVGVSTALSNANDVINGFFGICPPIVLAFFAFALVFLVVRKIIGR